MSFDQTNNHTHLRNVNSSLTVEVEGINPHELSSHTVKTFEKLRLNSQLLNGIYEMGFRSTSCLEEHALPQSLANPPRNLIVQSPNGTGKKVNKMKKNCFFQILH
jgi:superfamily II DNA/RNA helicase